jgi:hypothetical protein
MVPFGTVIEVLNSRTLFTIHWALPPSSGEKQAQALSTYLYYQRGIALSVECNGVRFLPEERSKIELPKRCFK